MHSSCGEWRIEGKTGLWSQLRIAQTLRTAPRILLWYACKAHWNIRCATSLGAAPSMEEFVTKWAGEINVATRWEPLKVKSKMLPLLFFLREGTVPKRHINCRQFHPHAIPDAAADPKGQRCNERKATVAEQVKRLATTYVREGWQTFFFAGSAKWYP